MSKHTPYWTRVINNAIKRKDEGRVPFTREHDRRAMNWVTCACGQQDPRLHDEDGRPRDPELEILACTFAGYVDEAGGDPRQAMETLLEIEARAVVLLAEMEKKNA